MLDLDYGFLCTTGHLQGTKFSHNAFVIWPHFLWIADESLGLGGAYTDVIQAYLENTRGGQDGHKYSSWFKCIGCDRRQALCFASISFPLDRSPMR